MWWKWTGLCDGTGRTSVVELDVSVWWNRTYLCGGSGRTCVVEALKVMPKTEQIPRPAATESETSITPAIPMPLCEFTASLHRISEMQA